MSMCRLTGSVCTREHNELEPLKKNHIYEKTTFTVCFCASANLPDLSAKNSIQRPTFQQASLWAFDWIRFQTEPICLFG